MCPNARRRERLISSRHVSFSHFFTHCAAACLIVSLLACSAKQVKLEAQLVPSASTSTFTLQRSVRVEAPHTNVSELKAGTNWSLVGTIVQGSVFRSKDQVVIVNSFNVHEGYIVINDENIVGYYLPVEKTFVESKPVSIGLAITE